MPALLPPVNLSTRQCEDMYGFSQKSKNLS